MVGVIGNCLFFGREIDDDNQQLQPPTLPVPPAQPMAEASSQTVGPPDVEQSQPSAAAGTSTDSHPDAAKDLAMTERKILKRRAKKEKKETQHEYKTYSDRLV